MSTVIDASAKRSSSIPTISPNIFQSLDAEITASLRDFSFDTSLKRHESRGGEEEDSFGHRLSAQQSLSPVPLAPTSARSPSRSYSSTPARSPIPSPSQTPARSPIPSHTLATPVFPSPLSPPQTSRSVATTESSRNTETEGKKFTGSSVSLETLSPSDFRKGRSARTNVQGASEPSRNAVAASDVAAPDVPVPDVAAPDVPAPDVAASDVPLEAGLEDADVGATSSESPEELSPLRPRSRPSSRSHARSISTPEVPMAERGKKIKRPAMTRRGTYLESLVVPTRTFRTPIMVDLEGEESPDVRASADQKSGEEQPASPPQVSHTEQRPTTNPALILTSTDNRAQKLASSRLLRAVRARNSSVSSTTSGPTSESDGGTLRNAADKRRETPVLMMQESSPGSDFTFSPRSSTSTTASSSKRKSGRSAHSSMSRPVSSPSDSPAMAALGARALSIGVDSATTPQSGASDQPTAIEARGASLGEAMAGVLNALGRELQVDKGTPAFDSLRSAVLSEFLSASAGLPSASSLPYTKDQSPVLSSVLNALASAGLNSASSLPYRKALSPLTSSTGEFSCQTPPVMSPPTSVDQEPLPERDRSPKTGGNKAEEAEEEEKVNKIIEEALPQEAPVEELQTILDEQDRVWEQSHGWGAAPAAPAEKAEHEEMEELGTPEPSALTHTQSVSTPSGTPRSAGRRVQNYYDNFTGDYSGAEEKSDSGQQDVEFLRSHSAPITPADHGETMSPRSSMSSLDSARSMPLPRMTIAQRRLMRQNSLGSLVSPSARIKREPAPIIIGREQSYDNFLKHKPVVVQKKPKGEKTSQDWRPAASATRNQFSTGLAKIGGALKRQRSRKDSLTNLGASLLQFKTGESSRRANESLPDASKAPARPPRPSGDLYAASVGSKSGGAPPATQPLERRASLVESIASSVSPNDGANAESRRPSESAGHPSSAQSGTGFFTSLARRSSEVIHPNRAGQRTSPKRFATRHGVARSASISTPATRPLLSRNEDKSAPVRPASPTELENLAEMLSARPEFQRADPPVNRGTEAKNYLRNIEEVADRTQQPSAQLRRVPSNGSGLFDAYLSEKSRRKESGDLRHRSSQESLASTIYCSNSDFPSRSVQQAPATEATSGAVANAGAWAEEMMEMIDVISSPNPHAAPTSGPQRTAEEKRPSEEMAEAQRKRSGYVLPRKRSSSFRSVTGAVASGTTPDSAGLDAARQTIIRHPVEQSIFLEDILIEERDLRQDDEDPVVLSNLRRRLCVSFPDLIVDTARQNGGSYGSRRTSLEDDIEWEGSSESQSMRDKERQLDVRVLSREKNERLIVTVVTESREGSWKSLGPADRPNAKEISRAPDVWALPISGRAIWERGRTRMNVEFSDMVTLLPCPGCSHSKEADNLCVCKGRGALDAVFVVAVRLHVATFAPANLPSDDQGDLDQRAAAAALTAAQQVAKGHMEAYGARPLLAKAQVERIYVRTVAAFSRVDYSVRRFIVSDAPEVPVTEVTAPPPTGTSHYRSSATLDRERADRFGGPSSSSGAATAAGKARGKSRYVEELNDGGYAGPSYDGVPAARNQGAPAYRHQPQQRSQGQYPDEFPKVTKARVKMPKLFRSTTVLGSRTTRQHEPV